MSPLAADSAVTVFVRRRVKPGCDENFENVMREFIVFALAFPGNLGIHVLRSDEANPREYTVVDRFCNAAARKAFTATEDYRNWMVRLRALTEEDPHIQEMGGTSGWFTVPRDPGVKPPPKWKMAVVTFLGVYPLTSILPRLGARIFPSWPGLLLNVLVTGLVVAALTWLIMPNLARLFHSWLHPAIARDPALSRPAPNSSHP
jgi:uncharacterized protein